MTTSQRKEWDAWKEMCDEFHDAVCKKIKGMPKRDINDERYDYLVDLIRAWGESLAELRKEFPKT